MDVLAHYRGLVDQEVGEQMRKGMTRPYQHSPDPSNGPRLDADVDVCRKCNGIMARLNVQGGAWQHVIPVGPTVEL